MEGFCPLASGSKGNCLYLGTKHTKVLIDAGISARAIKQRLADIQVDLASIEAVIVTHEHIDHVRGLDILSGKMGIPIFSNSETAKAISGMMNRDLKFKIFSTGESFEFGDIEVHPFSIQHDTLDPVAFTVRIGDLKIGICTDLGFVTTLVQSHLTDCHYLYLEANHEPSMVYACNRPLIYKQRVLGRQGHLSNDMVVDLLKKVCHEHLKHVYLAHLSSECNHPELAMEKAQEVLKTKQVSLSVALQDAISQPILF